MLAASPLHQILDLARWAPSGDNTQPWRFELLDESRFVIHGRDTRDHCVYDLDGHPSQISLGALLETVSIAASAFGLRAEFRRHPDQPDSQPIFDVSLLADGTLKASPLIPAIALRSVQRRPYSKRRLTDDQKLTLESVLDTGYHLRWFEGLGPKWQVTKLLFANAKLRLTMREAFEVHRNIIDWGKRFSVDRVPDQALGADRLTLRLMRWAMQDWARVELLNRYLAGTWAPRLQMDLIPSLSCGAHFVLFHSEELSTIDQFVDGGRMVQRLWLTATKLGLAHQPELTPLIFTRYVQQKVPFTTSPSAAALAAKLAGQTCQLLGPDHARALWLGRLGFAPGASARSTRHSRDELTAGPA